MKPANGSGVDGRPVIGPGRRLISWLPALAVMGGLFYASSLPGSEINLPPFPHSDKLAHFLAYFALGWLISLRHAVQKRKPVGSDYLGMALGALYGICDEVHQLFVPFRDFSILDMVADGLGAVAACRVYAALFGVKPIAVGQRPPGTAGS